MQHDQIDLQITHWMNNSYQEHNKMDILDIIQAQDLLAVYSKIEPPSFVWIKQHGRYVYTSDYAQEVLGFDVIGLQARDFLSQEECHKAEDEDNYVLLSKTQLSSFSSLTINGKKHTLKVQKIPLLHNDLAVGIFGLCTDISFQQNLLTSIRKPNFYIDKLYRHIESLKQHHGRIANVDRFTKEAFYLIHTLILKLEATESKTKRTLKRLIYEEGLKEVFATRDINLHSVKNENVTSELFYLAMIIFLYFMLQSKSRLSNRYADNEILQLSAESQRVFMTFQSTKKFNIPEVFHDLLESLNMVTDFYPASEANAENIFQIEYKK